MYMLYMNQWNIPKIEYMAILKTKKYIAFSKKTNY